jgi:hypothetical protein
VSDHTQNAFDALNKARADSENNSETSYENRMVVKVLNGLGAESSVVKLHRRKHDDKLTFEWLREEVQLPLMLDVLRIKFPDADYLLSHSHSRRDGWVRAWNELNAVCSDRPAGLIVRHRSASDLIIHNWSEAFFGLLKDPLKTETFPWGMFHPHNGMMFFVQRLSDVLRVLHLHVEV